MAKFHNHYAILMISTLFLLNCLQITGQSNDTITTTNTITASPTTCGMESLGGCYNKHKALNLKIIAIFSILVASMIGVCLPMYTHAVPALHPDRDTFSIVKAFASGVILATGYMHVLPDSFTSLESKCLPENPWRKFPFTTFVAMLSAVVILMIDSFAMAYHKKTNSKLQNRATNNEMKDEMVVMESAGKIHAEVANGNERKVPESLLRHRIVAQVLEMGIVVHSVVIGLSLGASENPCTIRPLVAALCFHQLFEGMGLGGCIIQAEYGAKIKAIMVFFFSVTTPAGILLGIGLTNVYSETSPTALIVVGILNAASAGLLNYMALVDLLAADFMGAKLQGNIKLQAWAYVAVLLGAGGMSLMAKWA